MGGVDKGLQVFRGRPLVVHALAALAPAVGPMLISANRGHDDYARLGSAVVSDAIAGYQGPLAGIAAGLARCTTDFMIAIPCDAPGFPDDLVARLSAAFATPAVRVAIAATGERLHPIFCMMRTDVAGALARFLADGGRSVRGWAESLACATVRFDDECAFRNLNSMDELLDAERNT